jgi:HrpA-like RNA helicase
VYRLYTEETFLGLPISFPAEIKRVSLETLVLTLLNLGHRDVLNFPYLQQPSQQARTSSISMKFRVR